MQHTDRPGAFFVPLRGFCNHDSTEDNLYHPSLPPIFARKCAAVMPDHVAVTPIDALINDKAFADAMVDAAML